MTTIQPLGDRVVVRQLTDEEMGTKSASGIIIPDTVSKEKPEQGIVVAAGPGRWNEAGDKRVPVEVKEGDRVVFKSWDEEVKIGGDAYWIISESDIKAVVS